MLKRKIEEQFMKWKRTPGRKPLIVRGVKFIPGNTCIILDEIQDCKDARTALKFFKMDGRYDIIATGSLLGVKGSVPVGYEKIVDMYPLDFEEFLWANGISENIIDEIRKHFNEETPVPDGLHVPLNDLFRKYAVVGGMPEAVNTFLETNNISDVYDIQKNIIEEYEDDMVKYASDADKARIRECFESIP